MGNLCTHDEHIERIEYLETKLEDQQISINDLLIENKRLSKENSYFKRRLDTFDKRTQIN